MRRIRLTIGGLMATVLFVAMGFAVLRSGSEAGFQALYTLTAVILLFAALAARYFGPFWFGFALFGWIYFLLGFGPWMIPAIIARNGTWMQDFSHNPFLITFNPLVHFCHRFIVEPNPHPGDSDPFVRVAFTVGICHSLLTIPIALIGGFTSRLFATWSARAKPENVG